MLHGLCEVFSQPPHACFAFEECPLSFADTEQSQVDHQSEQMLHGLCGASSQPLHTCFAFGECSPSFVFSVATRIQRTTDASRRRVLFSELL
jgi:hypothetical protein